jgi:hypothetical protein
MSLARKIPDRAWTGIEVKNDFLRKIMTDRGKSERDGQVGYFQDQERLF